MPNYTYKCRNCEAEFDQTNTVEARLKPCGFPCGMCGDIGTLYIKIGATKISYNGNLKIDQSFNDRLKDIKKNLPEDARAKINDQIR